MNTMGKKLQKNKAKKKSKEEEKDIKTKNNKELKNDKETLANNAVKYLSVYVGNEDEDEGVKCFSEDGKEIKNSFGVPLNSGNFSFTVDVDDGRILDWTEKKNIC